MLKDWEMEHQGSSAGSNVYCAAQTQQTYGQRLRLENKGALPYVPLQAGFRSKKQV
jgi:hypothetical protein